MAKIACKGTVIQQDISATLTAVAQVTEMEFGEVAATVWDSTALDSTNTTQLPTGYCSLGPVTLGLLYDPALAGHQAITDDITSPPSAGRSWKLIHADSGNTEQAFTVAGTGFSCTINMNDGLRATVTLQPAAIPTFPT